MHGVGGILLKNMGRPSACVSSTVSQEQLAIIELYVFIKCYGRLYADLTASNAIR